MKITLIIPAKNEPESLPKVLDELKNFNFKIIVILKNIDKVTIKSISKYKVKILFQSGVKDWPDIHWMTKIKVRLTP